MNINKATNMVIQDPYVANSVVTNSAKKELYFVRSALEGHQKDAKGVATSPHDDNCKEFYSRRVINNF